MVILHLIGSAMPIVLLAFILSDLFHIKNFSRKAVLGRLVAAILLFIILLRT